MNRFGSILRMNLVGWPAAVAWPWGILLAAWAVNLVIWYAIPASARDNSQTFGIISIYIVTMIAFITVITQLFPFAMGISATRKTFYAAVATYATGQALLFGLAMYLLSVVERATDGWGVDLDFFGLPFLDTGNPLTQMLVYAVPLLLFATTGTVWGAVVKRWGNNGTMGLLLVSVLGVGGLVAWLTWQQQWGAFAGWFADQSASALFIGWPLLPVVLLLGGGYVILRRTVP
ncbi:MAG: hypothetical protein ACRDO0_03620 [Nocardioidaceae bacterium]